MLATTSSQPAWYQLEPAALFRVLGTRPAGLTAAEVATRLATVGPNVIVIQEKWKLLRWLWAAVNDLMVWLLVAAGGTSWLLGDRQTAAVFGVIVLINLGINFSQSWTADRLVQSLQSFLQPRATVRRDGLVREVPTAELVPGDVLLLEEGDAVSADVRLLTAQNLQINSFSVTGESAAQPKTAATIAEERSFTAQTNLLFAGSLVATGSGEGVVVATGLGTIFGGIATLSAGVRQDRTPLQKELDRTATRNTWLVGAVLLLMFGLSQLLLHYPAAQGLLFAVAVAAALVPEGLPLEVNIALLFAALRLGRQKAVVKRLSAVEALGSASIICTDKTGTLTRNEMNVVAAFGLGFHLEIKGEGYAPTGTLLQNGAPLAAAIRAHLQPFFQSLSRNNRAHLAPPDAYHPAYYVLGDPTEGALRVLGRRFGLPVETTAPLAEVPFDSARKMMSTVFATGSETVVSYTKGAPEAVLARVTQIYDATTGATRPWTVADAATFARTLATYAGQAYRLLAIAERHFPRPGGGSAASFTAAEVETDLTLLGFVAMGDPPRAGVAEAFALARAAHIKTVVLTGDNPQTAAAVARQVGMFMDEATAPVYLTEGKDLEMLSDAELVAHIATASAAICARVSPAQKLRIVAALKAAGYVVAVTGDGVNDAPALKRADIGVAMGGIGTATAKEAADIILLDDSYATLVAAIREGRTIYQNLVKTVKACFTSNFAELTVVLLGLIFAVRYFHGIMPLTSVQILLIDLFGEIMPLIALTFDPLPAAGMRWPPRDPQHAVLDFRTLGDILLTGFLMGATGFGVFVAVYTATGQAASATTATYLTIVLTQYCNILARRERTFTWSRYLFSNPILGMALGGTFAVMLALLYVPFLQHTLTGFTPLPLPLWGYIGGALLLFLPLLELKKWGFQKGQPENG